MFSGLYNIGDRVSVFLSVRDPATGAATAPTDVPTVVVYPTTFLSPTTYNLTFLDPSGPTTGLFGTTFRPTAAGDFTGILKYVISGTTYKRAFRFIVRNAGVATGMVRTVAEAISHETEGLFYEVETGAISFGRRPY